MGLNVMLFGSTGMIGQAVLLECLAHPEIESVLVVTRKPVPQNHPKIRQIIHDDLYNLKPVEADLSGYQACFYCIGITAVGLNEDQYSHNTYTLTAHVAETVLRTNPEIIFCYTSARGADSSGKGPMMWSRVKGRIENKLLAMPFKHAYMFRPGYIQPLKGIRSKTGWYNAIYTVFKPVYFLLRHLTTYVTDTVTIGNAMINVTLKGYHTPVLENKDINTTGRQ